ncbi:hypothetical protein [Nocardia seriolae]|uniref:hypothetical protein n=1 Tax=Nocardia seriolae TaxID=37332 RepID=UPI0003F3FE72|nr:hypothetical protein [Nocardia seriolae]QOW36150.1 hypothetical protein IMZ23_15465 [Nocardia seriolae]QUN16348.1 hypothetical protein KEC46_29485 [Nocardia seriolae]WKY55187.1 hypothetical protein Q5P07_14905 [Nocardia seriolae]WNJ56595.1 hypothetical protein RMO66_24265 [Nocardia seriolae]GAM48537.1 hypothetical protein NS07_v2contig00075-0047 [Nocardia seriolae]
MIAERFPHHYGSRLEPARKVIIGDAPNDIACARHAGFGVTVVTHRTSREELAIFPEHLLGCPCRITAAHRAIQPGLSSTQMSGRGISPRLILSQSPACAIPWRRHIVTVSAASIVGSGQRHSGGTGPAPATTIGAQVWIVGSVQPGQRPIMTTGGGTQYGP